MYPIASVVNCKLAEIGNDIYISKIFGIKCFEDPSVFETINLFLWAYNNSCSDKKKLSSILSKLIEYCKHCKPKKYKEVITITNTDYTSWYESQMYLDCLAWELENNGFINAISELADLCANLNVTINQTLLCTAIEVAISQSQVPCNIIARIDMEAACKVPTATIEQLITNCNSNPNILQEQLCAIVAQNIIQNSCIVNLN